jgi:hypothetical protein
MSLTAASSPTALLPSGTNYPQLGAGGTAKFIPEIWSGKLQVKFYKSTVLGEITNNDWEGEIKGQGDKVIIRSIPTITIRDYQKGQNLTNEVPESTPIELLINKGKYFATVIDDVDAIQADVKLMDMYTNDAAEQMKIAIDYDVLSNVYADISADNKGDTAGVVSNSINLGKTGASVQITSSNVLTKILEMGLVLDEQNVPEDGRWMVIPPWIAVLLKQSELRQAYLTGDGTSPLRNGLIGQIDRFKLYVSNNLYRVTDGADTCTWCYAGTRDAISFASQVTNVETLRAQNTFGNIMRGLNVYGYKVTKPEAIVGLYAKP